MSIISYIYDPGFRFRGPPPPPPNGLGPPRRRERSSRLVCVEDLTTRITCIHTYTQTIHTHIHTYRQLHTYTNTCMYIQTRPTHPQGGAGHTIHTHIHTYNTNTYIHPIHACTYRHAPPTHRGGRGKTTCPPTYKNLCTQTLWGGVGGGACRPGPYIYVTPHHVSSFQLSARPYSPPPPRARGPHARSAAPAVVAAIAHHAGDLRVLPEADGLHLVQGLHAAQHLHQGQHLLGAPPESYS